MCWALKAGLLLFQLFLNSSVTDIVLVTLLRTATETAIAYRSDGGPWCLGLPGWSVRSNHHYLSPPPPPTTVPNKQPRFCGRKSTCLHIYCFIAHIESLEEVGLIIIIIVIIIIIIIISV